MRDFAVTTEPQGDLVTASDTLSFVVQKHAASRLHYDFRLELGGVLLSWALPKGPSFDPTEKRLAVRTEDHPLDYAGFEGVIPPKQYGAGTVIVWDKGTWEPVGDARQGLASGKLLFRLHGQKLMGLWELVDITKAGCKQALWILFKKRDDVWARPKADYDVVSALPDSVLQKPLRVPGITLSALSTVAGARPAQLPAVLQPQLATLASSVPSTGLWTYEIKLDGYRLMARVESGQVALFTRGGHDWSAKLPGLVAEIKKLGLKSAWLDGEIVVLGEDGLPSFSLLQNSFDGQTAVGIDYFLFDMPYCNGYDLRQVVLVERRRWLKTLIDGKALEHLRYSADFPGDAAALVQSACKMKLEGMLAKRADAPYASGRTTTWLKLKCKLRQEFVVCGYTDRSDGTAQVGSLLLGVYDKNEVLISVGSVGTGWDAVQAAALKTELAQMEIGGTAGTASAVVSATASATPPFAVGAASPGRWSKRAAGTPHWVEPRLVAEVEYSEITADQQIRHGVFIALRSDKAPQSIGLESAVEPPSSGRVRSSKVSKGAAVAAVQVSHGDRVIDTSTGLTKLDLVRYYESVAPFMLPHLKGRPCALVRGPSGVGGELFFQKHAERMVIPGVREMDSELWPGHAAMLEVFGARGLAGAAQMNVIEFHTWNSTVRRIDCPDRMIFDLDPGEGTAWEQVQEAALLVRGFLTQLGLASYLKTSGGKGLHVVVPLAAKREYAVVKDFSKAVVTHLAEVIPSRFVAKSGPANRIGKLFVDYLRNGHGATTVAAFSARARPGLGVSMPVGWDELDKLRGGAQWTIANAREHLSFQSLDPWADFWKSRQTLAKAMRTLGFDAQQRT